MACLHCEGRAIPEGLVCAFCLGDACGCDDCVDARRAKWTHVCFGQEVKTFKLADHAYCPTCRATPMGTVA